MPFPFKIDCRQATHLVLQGEDRVLRLGERLTLKLHMTICDACPRFVLQVRTMRGALGRWARYRDDLPPGDDPAA